jgi:hypothetical protein
MKYDSIRRLTAAIEECDRVLSSQISSAAKEEWNMRKRNAIQALQAIKERSAGTDVDSRQERNDLLFAFAEGGGAEKFARAHA